MSPNQSPKHSGPATDRDAKKKPHQRPQQQMNGGESSNKKQATPSQKRLQKQQRQQQQAQVGQLKGVQPNGQSATTKRELDVKVDKLTDKNECCKLKISSRLEEFSRKAGEIKTDISAELARQQGRTDDDQNALASVEKLRGRLDELAVNLCDESERRAEEENFKTCNVDSQPAPNTDRRQDNADVVAQESNINSKAEGSGVKEEPSLPIEESPKIDRMPSGAINTSKESNMVGLEAQDPSEAAANDNSTSIGCFEPLSAKLDPKSKLVALKLSLEKQFEAAPQLLEPICNKLINMSHQNEQLRLQNECYQQEVVKLRLIKDRLGDLCRELQKSNNQIRIESLNLIKTEQHKAKDQAEKIQTTLAGVMKLFDENQQRNVSLRQENVDLQTKLKQLLEHCESWEQCVETAIKQRDIENRLVKTELARMSLVRNEEQERYLKEKQELLKAIETMKSHQSRVEDKEAKLRSDLSSYASKYDQCQELIQNGLGKFQLESKRMLKQIEQSRQDYVTLLNKYEASNKKIKQLLEEKHAWIKSSAQANKKLETLEKLCRNLKSENDRLLKETTVDSADTTLATCKPLNSNEAPAGTASNQRVPLVIINDHLQKEPN